MDNLHKTRRRLAYQIAGLSFFFLALSALFEASNAPNWTSWAMGLMQNVGTEAFGAFLIIYFVDSTLSKLQSENDKKREKEALIFQMSNPNDNEVALEALRKLHDREWVKDGSLAGKTLHWAKLQNADLIEADLRGTNLGDAELQDANLWYANLQGASLGKANLKKTELGGAKLQGTDLQEADMRGAKLNDDTEFDERTILPNGENWTPETDMKALVAYPPYKATTVSTR
jgi:hypothetical protein